MSSRIRCWVAILVLCCVAGCFGDQDDRIMGEYALTVNGTVRDSLTLVPIDSVEVSHQYYGGPDSTLFTMGTDLTDSTGTYAIGMPDTGGPFGELAFEKHGYRSEHRDARTSSVHLSPGRYRLDVRLDPVPGPVNARPSITSQPDTSCAVDDTLHLLVQAHDPDGDVLHYMVSFEIRLIDFPSGHLPEGGINSQTGEFWFHAHSWDSPSRRVTFLVDDGRGGRDSTAFEVHIPWSQGGSVGH
jgi:hypothetical protein